MPRHWVIAPFAADPPEIFEKVWQFDIANNLISIGWKELGDVSTLSREELSTVIASIYKDTPPATQALYGNMFWAFYHEIVPGDFIVARRGRKVLAGIGKVSGPAFYSPGKNPLHNHPNFLEVSWQETVKGLIICNEPDSKLSYALKMTTNIDVRYYSVSFRLSDVPL